MIIDYVVNRVEVLDPTQLRVVVQISIPRVVNGYGGGAITIAVPQVAYRPAIEAAVIRKFTKEIFPQQHELVLNGDCTKVEQLIEDLALFAEQSRRNARVSEPDVPQARETEGVSKQDTRVEVSDRKIPGDEAAQDASSSGDETSQADLSSVIQESPKE